MILNCTTFAYRNSENLHCRLTTEKSCFSRASAVLFSNAQSACFVFVHQQEPNLRATQYLTDIVQLQQCLFDSFNHLLDRKEARRITIGEFLQSHKDGEILTNQP